MPQRPPRARRVSYDNRDGTNAPEVVFDDRRFSASVGTIATAFCVGSVIALTAFGAFKLARAQTPVGPADGAPLMRAPGLAGVRDGRPYHAVHGPPRGTRCSLALRMRVDPLTPTR